MKWFSRVIWNTDTTCLSDSDLKLPSLYRGNHISLHHCFVYPHRISLEVCLDFQGCTKRGPLLCFVTWPTNWTYTRLHYGGISYRIFLSPLPIKFETLFVRPDFPKKCGGPNLGQTGQKWPKLKVFSHYVRIASLDFANFAYWIRK